MVGDLSRTATDVLQSSPQNMLNAKSSVDTEDDVFLNPTVGLETKNRISCQAAMVVFHANRLREERKFIKAIIRCKKKNV